MGDENHQKGYAKGYYFYVGDILCYFRAPPITRPFVTWNPVLHSVELFRYSLNNDYPIPDISLGYLVCCSMLTIGFSLVLYKTNESRLLESSDD